MPQNYSSNLEFQRGISLEDLRELAKSDPAQFSRHIEESAESGNLSMKSIPNLRAAFFRLGDIPVPHNIPFGSETRAISTSAFPLLIGSALNTTLLQAFDAVPTIGQDLVTEYDTNKKFTIVPRVTSQDVKVESVAEGQSFPVIGAGEDWVSIESEKNGRILQITREAIEENNTPQFLAQVNQLAEIAMEHIEELTLKRVTDLYGSTASPGRPYVYSPKGVGTALYSASANTPGTRAPSGTRVNSNALVDETDLDNARAVLAAMKNDRGKRISIPMASCILLVPSALEGAAMKILNSELAPGVANEYSAWGPRGSWRPTLRSTPKLDDLSTTTWYLGDFKRQFVRTWQRRMEIMSLGETTESYLRSDVAFQARVSWACGVGATCYERVVQSLSSTTAPVPA